MPAFVLLGRVQVIGFLEKTLLAFQYIDDDASLAALVAQYRETKLLVIDT